ncbi:DUF6152 family protein [Croceibacterium aestuarii]|uniref:DUF6152 family protein n=1 Tax=Croceibacterium aestuarii TaxID=3064139 RepID=UPI00272E0498|nr:DUF6152 family protein [Croceibacterium sp. D39]
MNRTILALAAAATLGFTAHAAAHHSAAIFDFRNPVTLKGTVKAIKVVNPHTHMVLTITDAKGTRDWDFEGHSASNFYRAGFTRGSVKAGDKISITIAPLRDGHDGGYIVAFTTPAGDTVGFAPPG